MSESIAAKLQAKVNRQRDLAKLAQGYTHLQIIWYRSHAGEDFSLQFYSKGELTLREIVGLAVRERPGSAAGCKRLIQSSLADPSNKFEFVPG